MAQQNKQSQFQQPSPRTTIISVVLFMLVAFFVGQQFLNMSSAGAKPTDRLITSEFVQAVEQDRATKVVYNAGDYTVSGSYYPAITAGSTGADAFNEAFQALNARMATLKNPETGKALGGVGTTDINGATLGVERNFTSTYYGGSLGDLMAAHPNVPYEVALPSPFVELLGTLLPFIIIGLILFFFFNQMQKANNSQMSFGKAKTKKSIEERPDVKGREKILQVHSKDKPIGSDVDLSKVAKLTPGFTGADLANLMNESALLTARRGKKIITQQEVSESMERVIAGPERKGRVLDEQTKHTIAYHESGHALVGHLLPHADPVHKISIISRGRALGYTLSIPKEDKVLNSLGEMRDELAVFMGGRVAEEIFCDDITTGASNDLERATKMARAIVTQYGMSAELGTQVFGQPNHEVFLGRDYGNTQDYSEETAKRIDDEVARIMKDAHDRAYEILASHREQMDLMANVLLERETVEGEACLALLDNTWDEYLKHEDEIIAAKEAEEAAARARDEHLADPNWKEEPVEPGDQDPNPPYREPAEGDGDDAPASASSTSDEAPVDAPAPQAPEQKGDGTER